MLYHLDFIDGDTAAPKGQVTAHSFICPHHRRPKKLMEYDTALGRALASGHSNEEVFSPKHTGEEQRSSGPQSLPVRRMGTGSSALHHSLIGAWGILPKAIGVLNLF